MGRPLKDIKKAIEGFHNTPLARETKGIGRILVFMMELTDHLISINRRLEKLEKKNTKSQD